MTIEAMKQALEALERSSPAMSRDFPTHGEAIKSLRQAIAEAEKQEPVAWCDPKEIWQLKNGVGYFIVVPEKNRVYSKPLYEHPQPQRQRQQSAQVQP